MKIIFILLLLVIKSQSAPFDNCPSGCTCDQINDEVSLVCDSSEFLEKLALKRYNSITSLVVRNASLGKLDPKLKYLKNVKHLDLSDNEIALSSIPQLPKLKTLILRGNNLKNINMSLLPSNLKELDVSHNYLSQVPKDWATLKSLKTLHLNKNRIDCDCSNVLAYSSMIRNGINIPNPPVCFSPKESEGKSIALLINSCSEGFDVMLDDGADTGSGFGEEENTDDTQEFVPLTDENGEFGETNTATDHTEPDQETESGSGDGIPTFIEPCQENCKTPKPLGTDDEKNASDLPSIIDQANILIDDVNSAFVSSTESPKKPVDEPLFVKKTYIPLEGSDKTEKDNYLPVAPSTPSDEDVPGVNNEGDDNFLPVAGGTPSEEDAQATKSEGHENYIPVAVSTPSDEDLIEAKMGKDDNFLPVAGGVPSDEDVQEADASKASLAEGKRATIYTITGIIIVIAILGLFICLRKRKNNKNRRQELRENGRELRPMNRPLLEAPRKPEIVRAEQQPLLNGQTTVGNGKINEEKPSLNTFKPPTNGSANNQQRGAPVQVDPTKEDDETYYEDVESMLRPKDMPELLTPRTERVTIRESTIPDSIPKTPKLVQRQRDSEGNIVIVPS